MKLGEVKIEALKIMFADYTGSIDVDSLQDLKTDENYEYINSMPESIVAFLGLKTQMLFH